MEIDLDLRHLLKRGALLAAANWPVLVIQFAAETTFQALLAVPIVGAAVLVALLLGDDLSNLLQGDLHDILTAVASTLSAEPVAFAAFLTAFGIVLVGGLIFMFLVKGGTVAVLLAASDGTGPIEQAAITLDTIRAGDRFSFARFTTGCRRAFRRYAVLGLALIAVYALSGAAYLGFVVVGYQTALGQSALVEWTFVTAVATLLLIAWITVVNFYYLLVQIVIAADDAGIIEACLAVLKLARQRPRQLGGVFLLVLRDRRRRDVRLGNGLVWGWSDRVRAAGRPGGPSTADCRPAAARVLVRIPRPDSLGRLCDVCTTKKGRDSEAWHPPPNRPQKPS